MRYIRKSGKVECKKQSCCIVSICLALFAWNFKPLRDPLHTCKGIPRQWRPQWAAALTDTELRALRDRVDIQLTRRNRKYYRGSDDVTIHVALKNVGRLTLHVFEINAVNYWLSHHREPDAGLDLDGLVAKHSVEYEMTSMPPITRAEYAFNVRLHPAGDVARRDSAAAEIRLKVTPDHLGRSYSRHNTFRRVALTPLVTRDS